MEIAGIILGSAILGTLLMNARTLGRMDAKLKTLCEASQDHEERLRILEHRRVAG